MLLPPAKRAEKFTFFNNSIFLEIAFEMQSKFSSRTSKMQKHGGLAPANIETNVIFREDGRMDRIINFSTQFHCTAGAFTMPIFSI
jgi:hypothetical protein